MPLPDAPADALARWEEDGEAHAESCATCIARERWADEHGLALPVPPPSRFARTTDWIVRQPPGPRAALVGALFGGGITLVRTILVLPFKAESAQDVVLGLGAVLLAAAAGAIAGLVYWYIARPLERVPIVGNFLSGIVAAAAFFGCIAVLLTLMGERNYLTWSGATLFGFSAVVAGIAIGYGMRPETRRPERA